MFFRTPLYGAALLSQVLPASAAIHEQLAAVPAGWRRVHAADDSAVITLSIGLRLENLHKLEPSLAAVSDPRSSQYGQYLDADAVNSLFAPSAHTVKKVATWLSSHGITKLINGGQFISFAVTINQANALLNTTFDDYENDGLVKTRTVQYCIPDDLSKFVDFISPTTFFGKPDATLPTIMRTKREKHSRRGVDVPCQTSITPTCIKELYNIGSYTPKVSSGSRIGFSSFLNQSALYRDLFAYEKLYNIASQNISVVLINNATNNQDPNTSKAGEADLDIQNILGVSHPLPVTEYITGGKPPFILDYDEPDNGNEAYLPFYNYLLSQPNSAIPQVITSSYYDDEHTVPEYYAKRVCNMIGMLGLRGVTVLECSGDSGLGFTCLSNDGKNSSQFIPAFPATCPYITSVGGTVGYAPEVAWNYSSGGFSKYFDQAWYQRDAVQTYLRKYISKQTKQYYQPFTNFKGRGFPDISAHSADPNYRTIQKSKFDEGSGTSASAPVVAGIVALLNDARLRAGKKTLGFINPLLYSVGTGALTDITGGGSVGCIGEGPDPRVGLIPFATWNATVGWDPVTGLGTPNFEKLRGLVLSLP